MPRNAAELRAAAIATGLFDGPRRQYVGDGYSVPYQVCVGVAPIPGGLMWAYKAYLDARWKEFSRLHDWLYTPYGGLINATQEESDLALREELDSVSTLDAETVYHACATFGHLYFGRSTIGYGGEGVFPIGPDMVLTPGITPGQETFKMPTKVVILFQQTSVESAGSGSINYQPIARTGGWSESMYGPDTVSSVLNILFGPRAGIPPLLAARATCLSAQGRIVGVRLYSGGAGKGQLVAASFAGPTTRPADVPSMALLCSATQPTSGLSRRWTIRGVPDGEVTTGEFAPSMSYAVQIATYFDSLQGMGWMAAVESGRVDIFTVDTNGNVITTGVHGFAVGNLVTFKNVLKTTTGKRVGGVFEVETIGPLGTNFKVRNWTFGAATSGNASLVTQQFQSFTGSIRSGVRVTNRKVGRPFAGYRGRRSNQPV
jgi:hypothetical protein